MKVSGVQLHSGGDGHVLSGSVGGFELWFRVSSGERITRAAEPFLCAGLLPAMAKAEPLELTDDAGASPRLLLAMDRLQEIFSTWNRALRRVEVRARQAAPPPPCPGVASFFSGGVDSLYTLAERREEITHLVLLHGFDYRRQNRELAESVERENRRFATAGGLEMVVMESNFRELYEEHGMHPDLYVGALLGTVAHVLGYARAVVSASCTWSQLVPRGTHPLTDALWSTESVEIEHYGNEARRVDKLRRIAELPEALGLLRVCLTNSVYNCGVCEKCLRTRASLRLARRASPRLAPLDDLRPIRRLRIKPAHRIFWQENLEAAVEAGDRPLARAIAGVLARHDIRRAMTSVDRAHLGSSIRRALALVRRTMGRGPRQAAPLGSEPPDVQRL